MKSLRIGDIKLKHRIFCAPMIDVTDLSYRLLCKKYGAAMTYTEMLHIESILHENKKTQNMLKSVKSEKPVGVQITGSTPEEFKEVAKHPALKRFDLVDINCGCPSIRITENESGSYLLRRPDKIGVMIKILKNAGFTTTAKIRLGFRKNNVMQVAKMVEKAGADLLTIHARLAYHGASIPADWKWIVKVKNQIGIPVVGNGDVFKGEDAARMLDVCDGAMIARAAIGNPMIFKQILHYLKTGKEKPASSEERIKCFIEYLRLSEKHGISEMPRIKYLGGHFLHGFSGAAKARAEFMLLKDVVGVRKFLESISF